MLLFLLILLITTVSSKVSDKCVLNSENGVCEYLKNCPRALHELNFEGKLYTRCEEGGGVEPIVCCLPNAETTIEQSSDFGHLTIWEQSIYIALNLNKI